MLREILQPLIKLLFFDASPYLVFIFPHLYRLLGLCNNFAYVVMLSAAHDILEKQESRNETASAVLLADILPTLFIKLFAPFVIHKMPYGIRVLFCAIMAATSFLLVSFSSAVWMSILGVIFASISSGLGELSFLSLTCLGVTIYRNQIASETYKMICRLLHPNNFTSYFLLLVCPPSLPQWRTKDTEYAALVSEDRQQLLDSSDEEEPESSTTAEDQPTGPLSFRERLFVIRGLWRFVLPLGVVYLTEYFINQGLMELLFFHNIFLTHAAQYRWYQTLYQLGVLLSRSSLHCVKIRRVWILSVLQV
ncbi:battenin-like [Maylandia zebra]|uniref:battenin-like n=1 Tax=Maylandia zebra TaxID=106582 RepID=UPI00403CA8C0